MAGDSITAQRMHTNYIEAYYRTRFPKLKLVIAHGGMAEGSERVLDGGPIRRAERGLSGTGGAWCRRIVGWRVLLGHVSLLANRWNRVSYCVKSAWADHAVHGKGRTSARSIRTCTE